MSSNMPAAVLTDPEELAAVKNRFTVYTTDFLGRGGFGEVFRGLDNQSGAFVAVKQVRIGEALRRKDAETLLDEFRLLSSIPVHPNIVAVLAAYIDGDVARVFLEWVPGGSMHSMLARTRFRLHEGTVRRVMRDALHGLAHLHAQHVVHRDIKPGNMLVDSDGRIKLADFGASKLLYTAGGSGTSGSSSSTAVTGTVRFMAPEVVRGKPAAAADIWALGCTVVYLMTGTLPWDDAFPVASSDSDIPLMFHIGMQQPPNHMPKLPHHASPALRSLLELCFTFAAEERPTAAALLAHSYFSDDGVLQDAEPIDAYHAACDNTAPDDDEAAGQFTFAVAPRDMNRAGSDTTDLVSSPLMEAPLGSNDPQQQPAVPAVPVVSSLKPKPFLRHTRVFFATAMAGVKAACMGCGAAEVRTAEAAQLLFPGVDLLSPRAVAVFTKLLADELSPQAVVAAFPGSQICQSKCEFSIALRQQQRFFGTAFDVMPKTWTLPEDKAKLDHHLKEHPPRAAAKSRSAPLRHVYIVKPNEGAGGDGIYLADDPSTPRHGECVVQEYVPLPLTLEGRKVDFRLFVTVVSCFPTPRVFVHREGLARVAVLPYERPSRSNLSEVGAHLTNCTINKHHANFVMNENPEGDLTTSRRRLTTALAQLERQHAGFSAVRFFERADEIAVAVISTVILRVLGSLGESAESSAVSSRSFQLFAMDVVVDTAFQLHLLEASSSPAIGVGDDAVDDAVKSGAWRTCVRCVSTVFPHLKSAQQPVDGTDDGAAASDGSHGQLTSSSGESDSASVAYALGEAPASEVNGQNLFESYVEPFLPLLDVFVHFCGTPGRRRRGEMSSVQFSKLCRAAGVSGAPGTPLQTPEVDLIFMSRANASPRRTLTFADFVDVVVNIVALKALPNAAQLGQQERLATMAELLAVAMQR